MTTESPIIGAWYVNPSCQFVKVWAIVYVYGRPKKVVLSYLSGIQEVVSLNGWYDLELERYPQRKQHNKAAASSIA